MEAINCGNTKNTIEITYENKNEEEFSVIVEASKSGKDEVGYWPSDWLNTSLMKKKNKWHALRLNGSQAIPFQNTNSNVSHVTLEKGLYVQLNKNANTKRLNIDDYLKKVLDEIKDKPLDYAIPNLRFNVGGNYHIGRRFIKSVNQRLFKKPFYVIIGNGTIYPVQTTILNCTLLLR